MCICSSIFFQIQFFGWSGVKESPVIYSRQKKISVILWSLKSRDKFREVSFTRIKYREKITGHKIKCAACKTTFLQFELLPVEPGICRCSVPQVQILPTPSCFCSLPSSICLWQRFLSWGAEFSISRFSRGHGNASRL